MALQEEMEALARERGPALVGYAYLLTGDTHAARDLVQEAFVRTFARRRVSGDVAWLEAFVRRVILNVYLDGYRRRRTWVAVRHRAADERPTAAPDVIAADRADVAAAMDRLTPRQRACVVLRYFEDRTVLDIAATLAISEGAVKRYLSEARESLGLMLSDREQEFGDVITTREKAR